ncbi:MAG: permease, partial [Clostridia bacterium]|nr:permease [Clostridia bacterium]
MNYILEFLSDFIKEFVFLLPYFFAGVAIEALIRTFKWHIKIKNTIKKYGIISIFIATALGLISPLCACGVLPLSLGLLFGGVPFSTVMALLITSPLMSPAGYTLTQFELGTEWAVVKLISAVFMGIYAGLVTYFIEDKYFKEYQIMKLDSIPHDADFHDPDFPIDELRCSCHKQLSHRVEEKTRSKFLLFLAKFYEGAMRIGKYLLIGIFFEILISKYVPPEWVGNYLSKGNPLNILMVIIVSIPLYVNQISASAILYGLLEKGISK